MRYNRTIKSADTGKENMLYGKSIGEEARYRN